MSASKILLVASEVAPFAKTGGLADVTAALARYLGEAGHDVRVLLPCYADLHAEGGPLEAVPEVGRPTIRFGTRELSFTLRKSHLPGTEQAVHFVDCPAMYHRRGYYTNDPDEPVRWGLLCRAALEACQHWGWAPDVVHVNDWHAALLPLYLKTLYAWDRLFADTRTLLTIHNIGYQGVFGSECLADLGLDGSREFFWQEDLRDGRVNFLKTGILYAHGLTTVSPTYAREIQTSEFGAGLEGLLRERHDNLVGILNGVDYAVWSPERDERIPHSYSAGDLAGKKLDRAALLKRMEVAGDDPRSPVVGIVSRLTGQKGFEILPDVLPVFLQRGAIQLCVLGSGEERYERYFHWLREAFPDRVGYHRGYDDRLAHLVEAGSDIFLMPSLYEPCGLNQMYSLRYGTIPIVRRTGGLADTVEPFDPETGQGTGFVFEEYSSEAVFRALELAVGTYRKPRAWSRVVQNAMAEDFSWERQAALYSALYDRLLEA